MDVVKLKEDVFIMAKPIVENLGYELVEVNYEEIEDQKYITVVIYKQSGITFEDCKLISRALDEPMDELDPTNGESYSLNVSSLGLDRPLKSKRDYERFVNQEVEIYNPNKIVGTLLEVYDDSIKLKVKNVNKTIKIKEINKAVPYIKF